MSVTVAQIRAGLVANLLAEGFDGYPVSGYELGSPKPPCIEVAFSPDTGIEYNLAAARGLDRYDMIVRGIVSQTLDIRAQEILDEWCAPSGSRSVRAAIESDQTLGGIVEALAVVDMRNYRAFAVPSLPNVVFLAAEWSVEVYASGE